MKEIEIVKTPVIWTIGASDSSGGSGIQADLHTFHDFSVHGCTVITALNAQNSFALGDTAATPLKSMQAQISALNNDMPAKVIKLGMMPNKEIAQLVSEYLQDYKGFVVYDLELESSGQVFLDEAKSIVKDNLLPRSDLVIANTSEVKTLCNIDVTTVSTGTADLMEKAAQYFLGLGAHSILITGSRISSDNDQASSEIGSKRVDYWSNGENSFWVTIDAIETANNQAGGCTLSASIAALIGNGEELKKSIELAKAYVTRGIRGAQQIGNGPGTVAHLGLSESEDDLPLLSNSFPDSLI